MSFSFRDNIEKMKGYTPGFQPSDASCIKINLSSLPTFLNDLPVLGRLSILSATFRSREITAVSISLYCSLLPFLFLLVFSQE